MTAQMTFAPDVLAFVFAGDARFTLVSKQTGTRFTYRVRKSEPDHAGRCIWFVSVLTGADNTSNYSYIGTVRPMSAFKWGHKSRISEEAPSVSAFAWFVRLLVRCVETETVELPSVEFWHEGRCGRCARALTVPESIASGLGPDCRSKLAA